MAESRSRLTEDRPRATPLIRDLPEVPLRPLDPSRPYKPLDVGEGGLVASVDRAGRFVALTQVHSVAGWVVASPASPLDPALRFDQASVRRFRTTLAASDAASFGLSVPPQERVPAPQAWLASDALPVTRLANGARLVTVVPDPTETGGARGVIQLVLDDPGQPAATVKGQEPTVGRWSGRLRLDRAELPELTEVAPVPPLERRPRVRLRDGLLAIEEPALPWALAITGDLADVAAAPTKDGFVEFEAKLPAPRGAVVIGVAERAGEALAAALELARIGPAELVGRALERWRQRWAGLPEDPLIRRGLGYALSCVAAPVGDAVALVTDHRLLPLVWTRDAYFVAKALLGWWARTGLAEARELVRRHLHWLFETAVRPEGWWARSHLANGDRKDEVFQLDQQLYPLLELVEYVVLTGDRRPLERWLPEVERALRAVRTRRAPGYPLYATEETAADDPARVPYLFANHVLLVRVLEGLDDLGVDAARLLDEPATIRRATREAFVVAEADAEPVFAYGTNLSGTWVLGHDANDLPLVMAPAWGFCPASDPIWRATVARAFSPRNPSFFSGLHAGLGSLHTPGPWPLGHVQARLVARVLGDPAAEQGAVSALAAASYWDGALPEASDPATGEPISRPWFAWPGAAHAALELGALG